MRKPRYTRVRSAKLLTATLGGWWSPLVMVPIFTLALFMTFYALLYPLLSHDKWGIQMGSVTAIQTIAVLAGILIPLATSQFYRVNLSHLLLIWGVLTGIAFSLESRQVWDGNQNHGLAGFFMNYQLAATTMTAAYCAYRRLRAHRRT